MSDSISESNIADVSDEQRNTTHDETDVIATNVSPETADERAQLDASHESSIDETDTDIESPSDRTPMTQTDEQTQTDPQTDGLDSGIDRDQQIPQDSPQRDTSDTQARMSMSPPVVETVDSEGEDQTPPHTHGILSQSGRSRPTRPRLEDLPFHPGRPR